MSLHVDRFTRGWAVVDAAGVRVSSRFTNSWDAEMRMENLLAKAGLKLRPCFTCQREFPSEGPHNRMCNGCRKAGSNLDQGSYRIIRTSGRRA